jgi:argininosuccinate lyase
VSSPSRSGVFEQSTDQRLVAYGESISFDHRLYRQDIRGSIAHARMLWKCGILLESEFSAIEKTLREIEIEIGAGRMSFRAELEDIHMHIEQALIDRLGDVGRKLHTARSRNDQISTDIRMWVRDQIEVVDSLLHRLQLAFLHRCEVDRDVVLPAYTHLQRAQPVLAAHYWLAYIEKFARDRSRLADCRRRLNECPLGGAAVAGTSLPIDRRQTAAELGFAALAANSIDISSDRDFAVEAAFVLAMIAEHLSSWSEEWILWSTVEFNFIQMPHQFCTGSSIMPQKVNPDTLELTRGKAARVIGNLQTLLVLIKSLPLAYNRDLQEDKPPLFNSFDTVTAALELAIPIVTESKLNSASIAARLEEGFLDATTLMEQLIKLGMPQRTAHHLVGSLVAAAKKRGVRLVDLTDAEFKSLDPNLKPAELRKSLGVRGAVESYQSIGSSNPRQVQEQVDRWTDLLSKSELGNYNLT